jgi:hypothetical protein
MSLLRKMDRLVYATGLDRIIFMKVEPRTFRWTPLLVIAALIVGYVEMAQRATLPGFRFLIGWTLFYGAYLIAAFLRLLGPRFSTASRPLDEREAMVKARAYAMSGIVLTGCAMLGCFYMPAAGFLNLWRPHTPNDWIGMGLGIQAAAMLLPTMIASWLEPRPVDRDD